MSLITSLFSMHLHIWCFGRNHRLWMLLKKLLRYDKGVIGQCWWLDLVWSLDHDIAIICGAICCLHSQQFILTISRNLLWVELRVWSILFLLPFWTLSYYFFMQAGNFQCKCSWDNFSYKAPGSFHAKAGEGSFGCGMWKLMFYHCLVLGSMALILL